MIRRSQCKSGFAGVFVQSLFFLHKQDHVRIDWQ